MKRTTLMVLVGLLALCKAALATSFNCVKAQSKVEKMICSTPELSKLDEQMSKAWLPYRERHAYEEHVRGTQKSWLNQRNRCADAQCLIQTYQARIQELASDKTQPVMADEFKGKTRKFDHCRSIDEDCTENGNGYIVCEAYLKHLNAMPADQPRNACRPWVDGSRADFSAPDWEVLDPREHARWIYELDKILNRGYKKISPRAQNFDQWRAEWLQKIASGELQPRLKRTRLTIDKELGEESFVAYDDKDASTCSNDQPLEQGPHGSGLSQYDLFVMRGQPPSVTFEKASIGQGDIVLFHNKPYWIWHSPGATRRFGPPFLEGMYVGLSQLIAYPPERKKEYLSPSLCQYHEVWPLSTSEQVIEQIHQREQIRKAKGAKQ